ncbi:MAG TPA: two-component regulator propeller domain-containing protein [Chryseosolibacter sp.]|nr:two-component regulator propeller domain-containing protein [Chryseosolibacter sp.]
MRKVALIGCFLLWAWTGFAQFSSYTIRNYKAIDGLPQSSVNILLEDKNGYLWIGTEGGGLARYDGREFKVYTTLDGLLSNIVIFLKIDQDQNLWIVHPRGLTKFDGISFKKFQQPGAPSNTKRIRKVFQVKDTLFFMSAPGHLGKIHGDSVHYWSRPWKNNVLVNYCHVTPDKKVLLYMSDSTFVVRTEEGDFTLTHAKRFNRLFGLLFNYKDDVWMRTDSGYFTIDFNLRDFKKVPPPPFDDPIIFYDTLNDFFWTRNGNNVLKAKVADRVVDVDTVLRDINVKQILVDSEGNTWLATAGAGLFKYFIQDFDRCSSDKMKMVMAIHSDRQGANWIGLMSKGLYRVKNGKISSYYYKEPYRNSVVSIGESPGGDIWIGTYWGLGKYNAMTDDFDWFTRDDGLSNAAILGIDFDEKNGMWLGTHSGGVNYYDGKSFRAFTMKEGLTSNTVNAIHYSKYHKKVFVGNEFGLNTISGSRVQQLAVGGFENTTVLSIHPYRDSLILIGSGGAGAAVYNPRTHFKKMITTHQGIPSDFIYFIAADEQNYIWIGSEKGITRIKLNDAFDVVENLHYDYENGLAGVETNQNAFYLGKDHKYFGLIDGLYEFNDLNVTDEKSFPLHLTDVQILYGEYSAREYGRALTGFFKIPVRPVLPPDQNHITFHFNRVDKRYPKSVKFKYFLENFDKTWSKPSSSNQVTYSNLPPGDYKFRVMSTNSSGSWSPKELIYSFTVKTPFYQTASFITGVIILIAGAVTLMLYLRVKQRINKVMMLERIRTKEQETLRKEIARDFHDEMGNQLTRIINYISLLKLDSGINGNGNGHAHNDLYSKVEDSAKYLYTGTRDFIWSIDPVNDELSKLFLHIRDFGEKLFEEKGIQFRAFNAVKEKTKLPYGFSREANLIFKEAMTNAFKYSDAKNVTLSLNRSHDEFEMTLEDDGVGFSTSDIQKSNGLKNIRERADRINSVLRIHSVKSQGTKIVLNFKLNKTLKYGLAL